MADEASDPRHHAGQQAERLRATVQHLRDDIAKVTDPQAKALFETAAEVLTGLEKAFRDFEAGTELAWRR